MSWTERLGMLMGAEPRPVDVVHELQRADEVSTVAEAITLAIAARAASFTLAEARQLPPVVRAKQLLCGMSAQFLPLAYRNGRVMADQPSIVARPDPFGTRYEFVYAVVDSLVENGCAILRLTNPGADGRPRNAVLLPHEEVEHRWDAQRFQRRYSWRGLELTPGVDVAVVSIGRGPSDLCGRGPLREMLKFLAPVVAAEEWALSWFSEGGVPETVLTSDQKITGPEAAAIRARWAEVRAGAGVQVLGSGLTADFPKVDPERAQLKDSRSYGATIVARGLGIPAALLHVETSGATITYTNSAGATEELVKSTLAPVYLAPLEQVWSLLLPAPQVVRFDLNDMSRASLADRLGMYQQMRDLAMIDAAGEDARAFEGWGPRTETPEAAHAFDAQTGVPA